MNLKILKLKSGEEIACQVLEETELQIKVFQPMIFRVVSSYDADGNPCDVTTLHDWLINTDDKNVSIPSNHITFMTEPNKATKKLYEIESIKEFDPKTYKTTVRENNITELPSVDVFGAFLDELIKQAKNVPEYPLQEQPISKKKRGSKQKKNILPPDMTDETELDRHMIMMQLYIPAEAIMNMISSGILDPRVLLDMIKEVKKRNRFTGDEKNRKDFGDKYSDWNPDPNSDDYK